MRQHAIAATVSVFVTASLTVLRAQQPGTAPANAARDPKAIVLDMLLSPDPKQQAWGAWYAGRDNMTALVPAIIGVVAQHHTGETLEARGATDIALDALIQFRANLPWDLIASLLRTRPTHGLILASRQHHVGADGDDDSDALDALMHLVRDEPEGGHDARWFAAANFLLARRPSGFARALLSDVRIEVLVSIHDGAIGRGVVGGVFGIITRCFVGGSAGPTNLPPWASYHVTTLELPGNVVLNTGPEPVYYYRELSDAGYAPGPSRNSGREPTTRDRLKYLAALVDVDADALPIRAYESDSVPWQGVDALDAAVRQIRTDTQRKFADLLHTLIAATVLTRDEASTVTPTIDVRLPKAYGDQ